MKGSVSDRFGRQDIFALGIAGGFHFQFVSFSAESEITSSHTCMSFEPPSRRGNCDLQLFIFHALFSTLCLDYVVEAHNMGWKRVRYHNIVIWSFFFFLGRDFVQDCHQAS